MANTTKPLKNFGGQVTAENPYGFTDDTYMSAVDGNDTEMFTSFLAYAARRSAKNPRKPIPDGHWYELEA